MVDANSRTFELLLQVLPNQEFASQGAQGSFGIVDEVFYEMLPAPLIPLCKLLADLQYIAALRDPVVVQHPEWLQRDWNLPAGLARPAPAQMPTANLLGWSPRERMTEDALQGAMSTLDIYIYCNVSS